MFENETLNVLLVRLINYLFRLLFLLVRAVAVKVWLVKNFGSSYCLFCNIDFKWSCILVEVQSEDLGKMYNLCFVFVDAEAADAAVRQQLSSLLFVRRMCEAKIQTLKYGDGEIPAFPSVSNWHYMKKVYKSYAIYIWSHFININIG